MRGPCIPRNNASNENSATRQKRTSIASDMSLGLSAVRPEMSARRFFPSATGGRSLNDVKNWTPCSAFTLSAYSLNSGPPGPSAPVDFSGLYGRDLVGNTRQKGGLGVAKRSGAEQTRRRVTRSREPNKKRRSTVSALTRSQEPRLDDKQELRGRALSLEKLLRVIPAHTSLGSTASHEDYFALTITSRCHGLQSW